MFTDLLNLYMKDKHIHSKDIAQQIGVAPSAISHWRSGRRIPHDSSMLYNLCKALNLDEDESKELLWTWTANRGMTDLIAYVEKALEDGAETDTAVTEVFERVTNLPVA